jgi:K+-sensing histidine kinase KdpD
MQDHPKVAKTYAMDEGSPGRLTDAGFLALAVLAPVVLTTILLQTGVHGLEYVFLYMGVVAAVAFFRGLIPSLVSAAASFALVDYFFVAPIHTFTISDRQDVVNLVVFFATAGVVGALASIRRQALEDAKDLTRQLTEANTELVRLNREQAETAQYEIRLARTEQQVQALKQSEKMQQEMLANVSHDLRTPIGTILTASTNLLRADVQAPDIREPLATIASEARRLNNLVTDTLDLARIEGDALQLDLEPLQLSDAIEAAVERLKMRSPAREVQRVGEDHGVMVLADWTRLGQILDNLVANADRFGPPGTPVVIEVSPELEGMATVRVVDFGPGVPDAYREKLFERFVRAPSDHSTENTGLGLAIVRGLVQAHAGTIALEDRPGTGAVFRFTLPTV